jgi:O-antigen/teichoic acid export membrane protein
MALKRNLISNLCAQVWLAVMNLAFIPQYIKVLGIEAYGLIGFFILLQTWLGLLDMGITPTLGREMARFTGGGHTNDSIRDLLRTVEMLALAVAAGIVALVVISAKWISTEWLKISALSSNVVMEALIIMGFLVALRFIEGIYRSAIVGLQRQLRFNVINILMGTLRSFGALGVLIWISPTIICFFLWQAAVSLLTIVLLSTTTYRVLPKESRTGVFSWNALRDVSRFAKGIMGITFLALLLTQIDKIILSKVLTLDEFGRYSLATTVAGVLFMIVAPITQAFYPKFCELQACKSEYALSNSFHLGSQIVSVFVGALGLVLIFFSNNVVEIWTQNAELAEAIGPLLSCLVMGNLLNSLMHMPYQLQLAHGWTRLGVIINAVSVVIFFPSIMWVVPRYAAYGAACVWIALNLVYVLIGAQLMFNRIMPTEKWRWYLQDVMLPIIPTGLAVGFLKYALPKQSDMIVQIIELSVITIVAVSLSCLFSTQIRRRILCMIKTQFIKVKKSRITGNVGQFRNSI